MVCEARRVAGACRLHGLATCCLLRPQRRHVRSDQNDKARPTLRRRVARHFWPGYPVIVGLHWLGHLARYIRTTKLKQTARPDFAFINCHLPEQSIAETAPASYARTLLHLRRAAQNTALLGSHALQAYEAAELTLRSMKSTMLANAAQIMMAKEHRVQQGHHRQCASLLSQGNFQWPTRATHRSRGRCKGLQAREKHGKGRTSSAPRASFFGT